MQRTQNGFTLIELLVVISIIGLLSSVVLASLNTARSKARDAQRMAGLKQIQAAIEMYALDNGGEYPGLKSTENTYVRSVAGTSDGPIDGCAYGSPGTAGAGSTYYQPGIWCRLETALSPYIKQLPRSTYINGVYYYYVYKVPSSDPVYNPNKIKHYGLSVVLERANDASRNDGGRYDTWYELGPLPAYCKQYTESTANNWPSWTSVPCSCASYSPYSGCGY